MPRLLRLVLILAIAFLCPAADAAAQGVDLRKLSRAERAVLQDAMLWTGHYNGLPDGDWGAAAAAGLAAWRRQQGLPAGEGWTLEELGRLIADAAARRERLQWRHVVDRRLGLQIGYPAALTEWPEPRPDNAPLPGIGFQARESEHVRLVLTAHVAPRNAVTAFMNFGARYTQAERTYRLDRPDRQVAVYRTASRMLYMRFDRAGGEWRGFLLALERSLPDHQAIIAAVSASFRPNVEDQATPASVQTMPTLHALLERGTAAPRAVAPARPTQPFGPAAAAPPPVPPPTAQAPRPSRPVGSGTAFVVRRDGTLLTNHHVVEGCARVTLDSGEPLRLLASDRRRDLALLQNAEVAFPRALRFRRDQTIDLGETTILFGYPLWGDNATAINVTNGIVTATVGANDDPVQFQLNAAMQPGNSGGPVLDAGGSVIGVAVSRLEGSGRDAVQAMNYAIRGAVVEAFLLENTILVDKAPAAAETVALRDMARDATPLVRPVLCWR